ncbi:MAG: hypothetical protein LBL33_03095 [Tannerella sp.]|jgi:hypothetical protein|nr:hypothetical protein [Tannerella sp.]
MLRNCLITERRDTPPARNRIRFYTSRGKDLCITGILRTGSGLLQSNHVVEALPIHRGRRLPCIVEAGFHASWKQASMHRGSRLPCIVGAGAHTSWAQAPIHRGRRRPCIMKLISTKSYRVKYNTGSGYAPSLLHNAQPVRGYAGQLRNMS